MISQGETVVLSTAQGASTTGTASAILGGTYTLEISGTLGAATFLQIQHPDGTWANYGSAAAGDSLYTLPPGQVRLSTGGGASGVAAWLTRASDGALQFPGTGGGGGGGGAVTIAGGADVTEGTIGDTQATGTVVGYLKSLWVGFFGTPVAILVNGSAVTQPVSAASLPLPTGASTAAKQPALGTAGTASTDVLSVQGIASGTALAVAGPTASGSAVTANPQTAGGRAATTNPTAVSDGQVVNAMLTKLGKMVVVDGAPRELRKSQKTTLSATTTETTIITAGAAGVFNDPYGLHLANSGSTATKVDIRDATAGSIIDTIYVPAGDTRGWMASGGSGFSQTTAANNWTAQCSAATTALEVTALFIQTT